MGITQENKRTLKFLLWNYFLLLNCFGVCLFQGNLYLGIMFIHLFVFCILNLPIKRFKADTRFQGEGKMVLTFVQGQCKYYRPECFATQKKIRKLLRSLIFQWVTDHFSNIIFHSSSPHVPHSNLIALLTLLKRTQAHSCSQNFCITLPSDSNTLLPDIAP